MNCLGVASNSALNRRFLAFEDKSPDFPLLTGLGQVVFGMGRDNTELATAVDKAVKAMWASCGMKDIGKKYGLVQDVWYKPAGDNFRAGVDRPKDYKLPSCD